MEYIRKGVQPPTVTVRTTKEGDQPFPHTNPGEDHDAQRNKDHTKRHGITHPYL